MIILMSGINEGSQMPRHLISDVHEWVNEVLTVPIYYLAKPQSRERAGYSSAGQEDPFELDSSLILWNDSLGVEYMGA